MTRIFIGIMLLAAGLFFSACTRDEHLPDVNDSQEELLQTKAVNTTVDAQEGTILLFLDEKLAEAISRGKMPSDFSSMCKGLTVKSVEPVFPDFDDLAKDYKLHRWYIISFPERIPVEIVARRFASLSSVLGIQYNTIFPKSETGSVHSWQPGSVSSAELGLPFNDPMLVDQWHYINNEDLSICQTVREGADAGLKNTWNILAGNPSVVVAICDEAVKYSHPDLAQNMWVNKSEIPNNGRDDDRNGYVDDVYGYNFVSQQELSWALEGDSGRGTHMAGTVAAVNNNGLGVCGIAGGTGNEDGVRVMSCQLYSGEESATAAARARAYKYAADNGASVLLCSYAPETYENETYSIERDALEYFINRPNCPAVDANFVICPAGDQSELLPVYSEAYNKYIRVSAIGPDFLPASYTNYGPACTIAAPGGDLAINQLASGYRAQVLSTVPEELPAFNSSYGYMQGTSMASSHVAGVIALGLSHALNRNKSYDFDEFLGFVYSSVNDLEYYMEISEKYSNGKYLDLSAHRGAMGTGTIDAWRLLMRIEGTPTLIVKQDEWWKLSLDDHFGGATANLTYTGVEMDLVSRAVLGVEEEPYVKNGKLYIKCTKTGSAKLKVKAMAGASAEFSREISILSRDMASLSGGWL